MFGQGFESPQLHHLPRVDTLHKPRFGASHLLGALVFDFRKRHQKPVMKITGFFMSARMVHLVVTY